MRVVNTEEWTIKLKRNLMERSIFIDTLGCQLNENDLEK